MTTQNGIQQEQRMKKYLFRSLQNALICGKFLYWEMDSRFHRKDFSL